MKKSDLFSSITPERKKFLATMVYISQTIRNARKEMGMTQAEFADYMGVKQNMVSRWENGHHNFSLETVIKIYVKLGIPLNFEKPKSTNTVVTGLRDYIEKNGNVVKFGTPLGGKVSTNSAA